MKAKIYKAQIDAPYGYFLIAVKSIEQDATIDILAAARSEFNCHPAMIKIKGEVQKSNSRILSKMWAIKRCFSSSNNEYWGYIKKL